MDCVHHWKIETPNGAGSAGSCIRHRFAAAFRIPPFHRDSWSLVGLRVKHHRWLPPCYKEEYGLSPRCAYPLPGRRCRARSWCPSSSPGTRWTG